MKTKEYLVYTEWSGYSRGVSTYCVDAVSEEDARERWYDGERVSTDTFRDDREQEVATVEELDRAKN